jgi:DTW domain-containing protein YfiP
MPEPGPRTREESDRLVLERTIAPPATTIDRARWQPGRQPVHHGPVFNVVRQAHAAPPRCEGCGLRGTACLCGEIQAWPARTRVVLVTHHAERRKSTNTGRLVALAVEGAEVRVRGERDATPRPPLPEGRRLLLFPHPEARALSADDARGGPVVLLVPDGTWNQARRILRRDPDARDAEPVTLPPGAPSRYGLRRAPREGTVSTLEAVARALAVLEVEGEAIERRLMEILDAFVERSQRAAGRAG